MLHRAMLRAPAMARGAVLLTGSLLLAAGAAAAQGTDFDWSEELRPGQTLRVFSVHGEITARRADGAAARVHGSGRPDGRGRFDIRFEARRVGDGVVVCALYDDGSTCEESGVRSRRRSGQRHGRADLVVEVPEGVELVAATGNGEVAIAGVTGNVHASSGNGSVRVGAGAGRVDAASGNGDVTVEDARAAVRASSGNGDIRVSTAAGPVNASTGNGGIRVRMAALREAGDMEFSSGNGSITLFLPGDFEAEVSAMTGHGGFDVEFPLSAVGRVSSHRLRGTIGAASRRLSISTGNGSVHLRRIN